MQRSQKVEKQKKLARAIFPMLSSQKNIYDAQTAIQAVAGFIKLGIANEMAKLNVKDVEFDLSKEKNSSIKDVMLQIHAFLCEENADDAVALLERFGNGLGQFSSREFMKNDMSFIKIDEFIA